MVEARPAELDGGPSLPNVPGHRERPHRGSSVFHIPNVAAMRWNGGLGAALGWNDPFPRCFLSRCSGPFGCHSVLSVLRLVSSWAGPQLPALCDPPRVPRALLSTASLTPKRTASGPEAVFQIQQSRQQAAMRWRGLLGVLTLGALYCAFLSLFRYDS